LIIKIFENPHLVELKYLGLLLQSQFGVHLLGYDTETLHLRAKELSNSLFLIDSSALIPFLAKSSTGHSSARLLLDQFKKIGSFIATTSMLAEEVAEHANWPIEYGVVTDRGYTTLETLKAAKGNTGYRSNAFLEGFLAEVGEGGIVSNYKTYLEAICKCKIESKLSVMTFYDAIKNADIRILNLDELEGFSQEKWFERDDLQDAIAEKRQTYGTYKHPRQVKAEAEALIIIRDLRNNSLKFNNQELNSAYFVSHTRAIDEVSGSRIPITIRPDAVLQWLTTLNPCSIDELAYLTNGIFWELSRIDAAIVNYQLLQTVFSPLISAAKEDLREELDKHSLMIANRYGEDAQKAFRETRDLDLPIVLNNYFAQIAADLAKRLKTMERTEALKIHERAELEKLRARFKARQQKAHKRKRAAASRKKKSKKKK